MEWASGVGITCCNVTRLLLILWCSNYPCTRLKPVSLGQMQRPWRSETHWGAGGSQQVVGVGRLSSLHWHFTPLRVTCRCEIERQLLSRFAQRLASVCAWEYHLKSVSDNMLIILYKSTAGLDTIFMPCMNRAVVDMRVRCHLLLMVHPEQIIYLTSRLARLLLAKAWRTQPSIDRQNRLYLEATQDT